MTTSSPAAVCLLSGGLDSATTAAIARERGYGVYALSFDYGQRHQRELQAAAQVADAIGVVSHITIKFSLREWGGSALTADIPVPECRDIIEMSKTIPPTYVPARNTIFLSFALGWAETIPARHIFIGVNQLDYSGYPDCRQEFLDAFTSMANLATKAGVEGDTFRLEAPLAQMSKAEIIREGARLGVDFGLTWSCYAGGEAPCGRCDSCILRAKGFSQAGLADPALTR